jgi:hypothetical protein
MIAALPYPPPYQDIATLALHLSICESTVENWVRFGYLPPPRKIGGKRLWQWQEVQKSLAPPDINTSGSPDTEADRIRNATKAARAKND